MKRALSLFLIAALSIPLPALAVSKNPHNRKARTVKAIKVPDLTPPKIPRSSKPRMDDPTQAWQPYSYP